MRATQMSAVIAAAILCIFSLPAARAGTQWFDDFVQELRATNDMQANMAGVKFVVGNDIWQPGREFKSGAGWLALACGPAGCAFQPASLAARPKSRKADDDAKPSAGQQLVFKLASRSRLRVIAWFSTAQGSPAWLKPGPVPTWYGGGGRPEATGKGSFEARVDGPGGAQAVLVPMALGEKYAPSLARAWDSSEHPAYFLQLRADGKRQLLLGQLGTCSQAVSGDADYLLWSGDLDGDGKPDFLVSFNDGGGGQEHLYLSGRARAGQIVGLAGQHLAPPGEGECDSEGSKL